MMRKRYGEVKTGGYRQRIEKSGGKDVYFGMVLVAEFTKEEEET